MFRNGFPNTHKGAASNPAVVASSYDTNAWVVGVPPAFALQELRAYLRASAMRELQAFGIRALRASASQDFQTRVAAWPFSN